MPDIRRALAYLIFLASAFRSEYPNGSPWQIVVDAVLQLAFNTSILLGLTRGTDMQWRTTPRTDKNMRLYNALLHVASNDFMLSGIIASRIGFGTTSIPPGNGHTSCTLFWWTDNEDAATARNAFVVPSATISAEQLFGPDYLKTRWIQFLGVPDDIIRRVKDEHPEAPNLGVPFDPPDEFQEEPKPERQRPPARQPSQSQQQSPQPTLPAPAPPGVAVSTTPTENENRVVQRNPRSQLSDNTGGGVC